MLDRRVSATIALGVACVAGCVAFGIIKGSIAPPPPSRPAMGKADIANCEITGDVNDDSKESLSMSYPNDFVVVLDNNPVRYKVSTVENQFLLFNDQQRKLKDWYQHFQGRLMDRYRPIARGSMMADAKIGIHGLETIVFSNYEYEINYRRPAGKPKPPKIAPGNNERKLKSGIVKALKQTAADPTLALPPGVKSIEINFTLAGDPEGGSGGAWVFPGS
jgi:hypothetical protein